MDYTPATPVDNPMAVSQPESYESCPANEIFKIEQEIERHERAIVSLKVERNSRLPIFNLPIEILCRIFQYTQGAWMTSCGYSYDPHFPSQELAWIAVTHVCQHWRNAALNAPSLWTRPPLNYPKWAIMMLERSRMAGVTVSFDNERSRNLRADVLAAVVSHLPHTTTLNFQNMRKQLVEILLTNLRSTVTPMLETLVIDGAYTSQVAIIDAPTRLPENAFLRATKLRRLSLMFVDIDWKSHLLSSLTDLTLERISPSARPSRMEFLSLLERNPGLQNLTLRNALPTSVHLASPSGDNRPRIPLLSLKNLTIWSEGAESEFFCNSVVIPDKIRSIYLSIMIKCNYNDNRLLHKLLLALSEATSFDRLGSRLRRATIVGGLPHGSMSFSACGRLRGTFSYTGDIQDYCEPDESALDLHLNLESTSSFPPPAPVGVDSQETGSAVFSEYFHGVHWGNLAQLIISGRRLYHTGFSATLAKTFGTLPQLRAVFVGDSCADHLIDALLIDSDKDPGLFPDSITFSGLCHIGFNDVTFDRYGPGYGDHLLKMDRLLNCLMNRYERGVEIYSVSVEECIFFDNTNVEMLQEIVVNVLWDGEEHGHTDDDDDDDEDREFYNESDYDEDDVYGLWSGY